MIRTARAGTVALLLSTLAGCAGEDVELATFVTPGFPAGSPHTISVFGVFRDGRMNEHSWDELAPKLASMLGPEPCPAAYGAELLTEDGALAAAIDDYSRNYGVTDPLLDELAKAAKGDLVLVLIIAGAVRTKHSEAERPRPAPGPGAARMRRTTYARAPRADSGFEVTASLFSPKQHEIVAALTLHYAGPSEDAAIAKIANRWAELFPRTTCETWDFQAHPVDADAVRALPEP
jgi:hypothetical protein